MNANLLENLSIVLNCFGGKHVKKSSAQVALEETERDLDRKIYMVSREYKISILPITPNFDIENLYPITDCVHLWNIFIVGNDKTYILANIKDPHIHIPETTLLPNKTGNNILPKELNVIFDSIWDKTLNGRQLQFYIVWNGRLYFINTYPFFNGQGKVIGAILFMRAFETMPETRFTTLDGYLVPVRTSQDEKKNSTDGFITNLKKSRSCVPGTPDNMMLDTAIMTSITSSHKP